MSITFFQLFAIGMPLLALPVLIHLINMMRHRRVEWAAMEFLLESQRKNSRWIFLKQLLLLLLRLLAVAVVVFILAKIQLQNEWSELLGRTTLHHIVLVDDTLSMTEQTGDGPAFENAKKMVLKLAKDALAQGSAQRFTVLPFTHAVRGRSPLMEQVNLDQKFASRLVDLEGQLVASQLRVGPGPVVEAVKKLLGEPVGEKRIYYMVSDFRTNEWAEPGDLPKQLATLNESGGSLRLIDCVETSHNNLAITDLSPIGGVQAANVPFEMEVTVKNFGTVPVTGRDIKLLVSGREDRLSIDRVAPGASEKRKFEVRLLSAGDHAIGAQLVQADAMDADSKRSAVVAASLGLPVLILDADAEARDAHFLANALNPGGAIKTGLEPTIERPDYLETGALEKFRTIYLTNVDHLEKRWTTRLEDYVARGGGLGVFLGKLTTVRFLNEQLYKKGAGLLPVPIVGAMDLYLDELSDAPDMQVSPHQVFRIFAGERNSFLQTVNIKRYFEVDRSWQPSPDSRLQVIARVRNGSPLAIETPYQQGRVVALLTSASPDWNNWSRNPSFPVAMQELQSYLTAGYRPASSKLVASPIEEALDAARYRDKGRIVPPGESTLSTVPFDMPAEDVPLTAGEEASDDRRQVRRVKYDNTVEPGVYELQLTAGDSSSEIRRYAFNVDSDEGNLAKVTQGQLTERLPGVAFEYHLARDFGFGEEVEGTHLTDFLLYLIVFVLLAEQLLAYVLSYHQPVKGAAA